MLRPIPPLLAAAMLLAPVLPAQRPDTAAALPELVVIPTPTAAGSAGLSVTILSRSAITRGRPFPDLDEALAFVPGVVARDRDRALDQRLAIRGTGARANFGVRGVRVLVDGVPATLPDGQTPLTTLALDLAERIEVVRGPLAAIHGNGSEGVVAISTPARLAGPTSWRGGFLAGSDATLDGWAVGGGGTAALGGLLAISRRSSDGVRAHARSEQWRVHGALAWDPAPGSRFTLRLDHADDPRLESAGALTLAEWRDNPRAAAPNSVLRDAGKSLRQDQVALGWRGSVTGFRIELHAWTLGRDLENPIAAPAPAPATPTMGTWIGIDRAVTGLRGSVARAIGSVVVLTGGVELQRQRDERTNRRHDAGVPFGDPYVDQRERTTAVGAFAQLALPMGEHLSLRIGGRHDRIGFAVTDRINPMGSGTREMAAWSGNVALALASGGRELWLGLATAFETPTTTELANRPDGGTGLNRHLDPERTESVELGARWRGGGTSLEVVAYRALTDDAIVPVRELDGRSVFANIGMTRRVGIELAAHRAIAPGLTMQAAASWLAARFGTGAVDGSGRPVTDNRLPGITPRTARIGLQAERGSLVANLEHGWSAATMADDANTIEVPGWGAGITDLAIGWRAGGPLTLHAVFRNLLDRRHVTGVVVNGGFGRVIEPGAGRRFTVGGVLRFGGR